MEDPEYIDLLVNPDQKILAIRASESSYPFSHKIIYDSQQDHELYSKVLLRQLRILHPGIKPHNSYRLYGTFVQEKKLVLFEMRGMLLINGSADEEI